MAAIWVRSFRLKYKKERRQVWGLKERKRGGRRERQYYSTLLIRSNIMDKKV